MTLLELILHVLLAFTTAATLLVIAGFIARILFAARRARAQERRQNQNRDLNQS